MEAFEYANPTSLAEALKLLGSNWNDAQALAGGTDIIGLMKDGVAAPKRLVNLKNIKELGGVAAAGGGLRIGATATFDEIATSAAVRAYPAIRQAALGWTSMQVRNMRTAGGDLCQRPRCWYFRSGFGVLGTLEGKALVPGGENRYHAIFGGGPAYFVSASSLGPALAALGAKLTLQSASGKRTVDAAKFFIAPKSNDEREIDLKPNEILTEIVVPSAATVRNATYEIREREAMDWPLATASVALKMSGSKASSATIVLGHVAPTPWVAESAGQWLAGKSIDEAMAEQAGAEAVKDAKPLSQNAYKVQLAKVAVKRALLAAVKTA